jgi:hypothetical protein
LDAATTQPSKNGGLIQRVMAFVASNFKKSSEARRDSLGRGGTMFATRNKPVAMVGDDSGRHFRSGKDLPLMELKLTF